MDQVTQQNAALVEQMAAAAGSLNSQSKELVHTVSVFNLGSDAKAIKTTVRSAQPRSTPFKVGERRTLDARAKPKPSAVKPLWSKPISLPIPLLKAKATIAAVGGDEWETF